MTILSKIGSFFGSLGHTIGSALSGGYSEVKNVVSGAGKEIDKQLTQAHDTINNVIQDGSNLATNLVNKGADIVKHTEDKISSTITMPLILIGAGIAGLLIFHGGTVAQSGAEVAKTAGPAMMI